MSSAMCRTFDGLWLKPLDSNAVLFYFSKIQQQQKLNLDYQLQQKYLDTLIDSIPDLIWFKDINGAHLKVNDSFCRIAGKTKEDIHGREHYYIWDVKKEDYEDRYFISYIFEFSV